MSEKVGAKYFELISKKGRALRYTILSGKTIYLVLRHRPKVIFFQNPSIVLALLCVILKIVLLNRIKIVGDFHNAALENGALQSIHNFISRQSDITIVTNSALSEKIKEIGGNPIVFPDPLPKIDFENTINFPDLTN
jgi:hypothetical protein